MGIVGSECVVLVECRTGGLHTDNDQKCSELRFWHGGRVLSDSVVRQGTGSCGKAVSAVESDDLANRVRGSSGLAER